MKFLLDENMDYRVASLLEQLGHDVTSVLFDYPPKELKYAKHQEETHYKVLDYLLGRTTMYRLVLYMLLCLIGTATILGLV